MRARLSSLAVLSWLLAFGGQAVAASHPAPGRFVPMRVMHEPGRTSSPGLNFPAAPPMRMPQLAPLTPVAPVLPAAQKVEQRATPDGTKRTDFPSPEPSPFSNPLHRLLMATAFGQPPI